LPCRVLYFETFMEIYDDHFSRQYSFRWPYVEHVIYCYLDCGDLHNDFALVKCKNCNHEYLLAFSCERVIIPLDKERHRHDMPDCRYYSSVLLIGRVL
jgi:hypothetical protein